MVDESSTNRRRPDAVLECKDVTKRFGATVALANVSLTLNAGETRALLGENGAGKSTLIKILAGTQRPDAGRMRYEGAEVSWQGPLEAREAGIAVVHQELSLVSELTVAENVFLSREILTSRRLLRDRRMQEETERLLAELGINGIGPGTPVRQLSPSQQQLVEIVKAVLNKPKVLILDEATSTLDGPMAEWLFSQVGKWRRQGVAIAFISHRMSEIAEVADTVTVLRNGRVVLDREFATASERDLINAMSGREVNVAFPDLPRRQKGIALEVRHLSGQRWPRDVSLHVGAGEIVGVGGLDGQGQRELLLSIYGLARAHGTLVVNGHKVMTRWSASKLRDLGVGFVPADRAREGLLQKNSIAFNVAVPWLRSFNAWSIVRRRDVLGAVGAMGEQLRLSTSDYSLPVSALSGGNQQKVVLAKWLVGSPKILILYDVTRGVDIGTKVQIYELLVKLAEKGVGVLLYTTDINELIHLSHRVYVMSDGRVMRELSADELSEASIIGAAFESHDLTHVDSERPDDHASTAWSTRVER